MKTIQAADLSPRMLGRKVIIQVGKSVIRGMIEHIEIDMRTECTFNEYQKPGSRIITREYMTIPTGEIRVTVGGIDLKLNDNHELTVADT